MRQAAALLLVLTPWALAAQGVSPPAYTAAQLDGSAWEESVRGTLLTLRGSRRVEAAAGREGAWRFTARDSAGVLALEGWFDSLAVWREAGGVREAPETDGVLGGRFHGRLDAAGGLTVTERPWVPDEVGDAGDVASALDDLLPPLPPYALQVGERWRSGDTLELVRLADSAGAERYRETRARRLPPPAVVPDSLRPSVRHEEASRGVFVWDRRRGLLRRDRRIEVELDLPAVPGGPAAVRTRLEQRVVLHRRAAP